jgi:uncharacterized protein
MSEIAVKSGEVLLPIARSSISTALGKPLKVDESRKWLHEQGASFVTLKQNEELRGCIGSLEAHRSLLLDVKANAQAAAFRDPRISPLTIEELDITRIEVSILSPKEPLAFTSEAHADEQLQPGIDGVTIEYGRHRSTFLPQVWEQLPSTKEFMMHLKQKAGLPHNFWSEDLKIFRYTVQKWAEADPGGK